MSRPLTNVNNVKFDEYPVPETNLKPKSLIPKNNFTPRYIQNTSLPQNFNSTKYTKNNIKRDDSSKIPLLNFQLNTNTEFEETNNIIESKLIIYSKSGHIIQKYRSGIRSITLPKSVDLETIIAIDDNGSIIPFSYISTIDLEQELTNRSTGEHVLAEVTKNDRIIEGQILFLDKTTVKLQNDTEIITIRNYDSVSIKNYNKDFLNNNLIQIIFDRYDKPLTLSYLIPDISWRCFGTVFINSETNSLFLRLTASINNNNETDIKTETFLVAGEVYQYQNQNQNSERYAMAMAAQMPMMKSRNNNSTALEDYVKYNIGERIIRKKNAVEIGFLGSSVIKIYTHQTEEITVKFGYRFTATEFIPKCSVNVYSMNKEQDLDSYIGSSEIEENQKGEEIDLILGESTLLQCKSLVSISDIIIENAETANKYQIPLDTFNETYIINDNKKWHLITEDLKVSITNYNKEKTPLILKHYVGNKTLISIKCQAYKKRENGYIEWLFQVPHRLTEDQPLRETFSCQIVTSSYY